MTQRYFIINYPDLSSNSIRQQQKNYNKRLKSKKGISRQTHGAVAAMGALGDVLQGVVVRTKDRATFATHADRKSVV